MAAFKTRKDLQMRQRIAQESARIMAESGIRDFLTAKRKAAVQLGATDTRNMPNNAEIEQAAIDYQRLFSPDNQQESLSQLLKAALEAMEFFERFQPRLVGPLLSGIVSEHAGLELHLFTEPSEEVTFFLIDNSIPYEHKNRRVRHSPDTYREYPGYKFLAGEVVVDLTVFPHSSIRQPALSPVDGRPMQRAAIGNVRSLILECE